MRMPTFGLAVWKEILDGAAADGANTIILWMGGAFRAKKFPITWQWAKEHENVRRDFARRLTVHAYRRGIPVLLGFTPFGYDGVNQLSLERPELKATGANGKPVREFGIGCWGWNLCPAKAESQRFMRESVREVSMSSATCGAAIVFVPASPTKRDGGLKVAFYCTKSGCAQGAIQRYCHRQPKNRNHLCKQPLVFEARLFRRVRNRIRAWSSSDALAESVGT